MEYGRIPYSLKAKSLYLCIEYDENKYEWLYIPLDGRVGFPCRKKVSSALNKDYEPVYNRFVAVNLCIYKVGIPSRWKEMHILDIKTAKWKKTPSMIEARYGPRVLSIGDDTICVIGGREDYSNGELNDPSLFAELYSHALNKWTPLPYLSPKFVNEHTLLVAAVRPPTTTSRRNNNNNEYMVIVGSNEDDRFLCRYHIGNQELVKLESGFHMIWLPIHPRFTPVVVDYKLIWFSGNWLMVYDIMQKCRGVGTVAGVEDLVEVNHDSKVLLDIGGGYLCLICLQGDDVRVDRLSSFYPEIKEDESILHFFIITVPIFTTEEEGDGGGRSIHAQLHSAFRRKIRRSDYILDALLVKVTI